MPDETVHALSDSHVERRFQVIGEGFRPLRTDRGFALLSDESITIDVSGASRLLGEESLVVSTAMWIL